MICKEARDLITALVDGELSERERHPVESHLKDCLSCARTYRHEKALKEGVRAAGLSLSAPASFKEKILADLVVSPERDESTRQGRRQFVPFRPAFAVALLVILALPTFYFLNQGKQPVALAALSSYAAVLGGDLPMIKAKGAEEMKEQLIGSVGGSFSPMGYDLSMMNLIPVAGGVHEINGRKILVTLYQGQGRSLICYTFLGTEDDAPDHAALFFDAEKKMNFYAFSRAAINAVLHREGDVICILVSPMPMQDLLVLARAKAHSG